MNYRVSAPRFALGHRIYLWETISPQFFLKREKAFVFLRGVVTTQDIYMKRVTPQHTSNMNEKFVSPLPLHTHTHTRMQQPYTSPLCKNLKGMCRIRSTTTVLYTHVCPVSWSLTHTNPQFLHVVYHYVLSLECFPCFSLSLRSSHSGQACCLSVHSKKKTDSQKHQERKSE